MRKIRSPWFFVLCFVIIFSLHTAHIVREKNKNGKPVKTSVLQKIKNAIFNNKPRVIVMPGNATIDNTIEWAAERAKIRPEFLAAVIEIESANGIGTGHWKKDMQERQRKYFKIICKKLGLNPNNVPVSKRPNYRLKDKHGREYRGWGGAMGVAQFMPKTWLAYEKRIAKITGNKPPSPFNERDATVGAALYLADHGAKKKTERAERIAALKYVSGNNWHKPAIRFYGNQVVARAKGD